MSRRKVTNQSSVWDTRKNTVRKISKISEVWGNQYEGQKRALHYQQEFRQT